MASRTTSNALTGLLVAAVATGWLVRSGTAQTGTCVSGQTAGLWDLPAQIGFPGLVDGDLFLGQTTQVVYHLAATLEEFPSPCLSCREGKITGTLDDGIGAGPDFIVRGRWIGSFFGGAGTWYASIFRPGPVTTSVPAGRMAGNFSDPPISPTSVGAYGGRWMICN